MKIKGIIIFIIAVSVSLSAISDLRASVQAGFSGRMTQLGDTTSVMGPALTLDFPFPRFLRITEAHLQLEASLLPGIESPGEPAETIYFYCPLSLGGVLSKNIAGTRASIDIKLQAGAYLLRKNGPPRYGNYYDYSKTETETTWGPQGSVEIQLAYIFSQNVTAFIGGGYQMGLFDEEIMGESIIHGYTASAGIKYTLTGGNRELYR